MSELKGLGIGGKITPSGDSSNTFPTHEDIYGFGGYMVAPPKSDDTPGRKLIAWERLKVGMLVYDDGTIYKCITKNQQPQNKATNNATWEELKLGNDLDNLEIGTRNLFAKKYMLDWNAKSAGTTTVNFDDYGEYYQIKENQVYTYVGGGESYNDILQGNVSFETSKQYCLKVKWRVDSVKDYAGLYLGFKYSDGTRRSWIFCAKDQTTPAEATLVSESGKTVAGIVCSYGMRANTRIYEIQLTEGNKAPSGWAEAEADKEIGGQNLYTGDNPLTITANATNNYNYVTLVENLQNDARYVFSCGKSAVKADSTDKYTVLLYDFNGPSSSQIRKLAVGTTRVEQAFTIPSTGTWSMLIYSGLQGSTAGIGMEFTDIMVQKGNKATGWTPAPEDLHTAVTDGEYPLLMKGDNVGEGYYDSAVKLNTNNNTISANISGYAKSLYEFYNSGESQGSSFDPNKTVGQGLCLYHCLNSTAYKDHWHPDWQGLGTVFSLGCPAESHLGQFAFDYSPSGTNHLFFRAGNSSTTVPDHWTTSSNNYGWKRIAWADDDSAGYLRLSGGTMTGTIKFNHDDNLIINNGGKTLLAIVPSSGGFSSASAGQLVIGNTNTPLNLRGSGSYPLFNNYPIAMVSDLSGQIPNKAIEIAANSDLNNITTPGFYYCPLNALAETLKNCPTKLAFSLRAYKDANSVNQILTVFYANARMYFRGSYIEDQTKELKWSSWKEIAYCQDYVKKSGDTMSGQLRIDTGKQNFSDLSKLNDEAALLLGKNQDTINGIAFARQDIQAIISTQSNPNTTTLKLNPLGGKVQVGPANTTTTVGISSSTITYNKTTGCLEIMA